MHERFCFHSDAASENSPGGEDTVRHGVVDQIAEHCGERGEAKGDWQLRKGAGSCLGQRRAVRFVQFWPGRLDACRFPGDGEGLGNDAPGFPRCVQRRVGLDPTVSRGFSPHPRVANFYTGITIAVNGSATSLRPVRGCRSMAEVAAATGSWRRRCAKSRAGGRSPRPSHGRVAALATALGVILDAPATACLPDGNCDDQALSA